MFNPFKRAPADPAPEAEWQVWYQDSFDRECPRQVEVSGRGLVRGLIELWARHLLESVRPGGGRGFSRFNLWWEQENRSITIVGDRAGAARLRRWAFGDEKTTRRGPVQAGDKGLLGAIAAAHAKLILAGRSSRPILALARSARDRREFEKDLPNLKDR